jgi:hypothetical protein
MARNVQPHMTLDHLRAEEFLFETQKRFLDEQLMPLLLRITQLDRPS